MGEERPYRQACRAAALVAIIGCVEVAGLLTTAGRLWRVAATATRR
jgi:hypothetical protein